MNRSMEATAAIDYTRGEFRKQATSTTCSTGPLPAVFVDKNEARPDGVDLKRIEAAVREILESVGEDPSRDGLLETPSRVARMYAEMFAGLRYDPGRHLAKVFVEEYDEIVLVRDMPESRPARGKGDSTGEKTCAVDCWAQAQKRRLEKSGRL